MQFRTGMMGVCVITLALAGALIGSWVLSMDVEEKEVTKYQALTDITGLFESDKAPEYIDYSPSTNYMGYYTDDSTIGNVHYFDGVDFTESPRANNYRLNLMPLNRSTGTTGTLTGNDWKDGAHVSLMAMTEYTNTGNIAGYVWGTGSTGKDVLLTDLLASLDLDPSIDLIKFSSIDGLDALQEPLTQTNPLTINWVLFSVKSMWYNDSLRVQLPDYYREKAESAEFLPNQPMLSCVIDKQLNLVTIYYDNEFKDQVNVFSLSDVVVSFGGTGTGLNTLHLGTALNYEYSTQSEAIYMDPSGGVSL